MLLNHPNSTLRLWDIQRAEPFLCFASIRGSESAQAYRERLTEWQRVVDKFQLDYAKSEWGPKKLSSSQCCPSDCEVVGMLELRRILMLDLGYQPWQAPERHWPSQGPDQQARNQIFHEFLLRNSVDPCSIGHRDTAKMTPTMIASRASLLAGLDH